MKVVVFADVHANIDAFELMVKENTDADLFISLGDIVNYSPFNNECVDLLESLPNAIKIRGNHEDAFLAGKYAGKNIIATAFFEHSYQSFDRNNEIKKYVDSYEDFGYEFRHTIYDDYIYPDSSISFTKNYMIGHSHRQFHLIDGDKMLVNPGSVGQNRINIKYGQYLVFYPKKRKLEFKNILLNIDKLLSEMEAKGYPKICLDYYKSKIK